MTQIMIDTEKLAKAVKLAQKPTSLSTTEIAKELDEDIYELRALFTELRKNNVKIPKNHGGRRKTLIRNVKKLL